jgi:hypothetical protein
MIVVTRASEIARMAFLVARATDSDQSEFDPDTSFKPVQSPHKKLSVLKSELLDLANKRFHFRKSDRNLFNKDVDLNVMGSIATAAYGYLNNGHRTIPSAGSYYPLTLHILRIEFGHITEVSIFDPSTNHLKRQSRVDLPLQDGFFVYGVDFKSASYVVLWSCRVTGIASKYGAKGYRFACFEVGHSAQMAVLECLTRSLKHVLLGGLDELWFQSNVIRNGRRLLPQYALVV